MKGKMLLLLFGLAIISYFLYTPRAQVVKESKVDNPVAISGKVLDEQDAPIAKAKIRSVESSNETYTDRDGNFMIESPKKGTIVITHSEYRASEVKFENQEPLKIVLRKTNNELIEKVKDDFPDSEIVE